MSLAAARETVGDMFPPTSLEATIRAAAGRAVAALLLRRWQRVAKWHRDRGDCTAMARVSPIQRGKNAATEAIAQSSLPLPRYRENDAAPAAIFRRYRRICGGLLVAGSLVIRWLIRCWFVFWFLKILIRKLLLQYMHGKVIENPAVSCPLCGPKTARRAGFTKIRYILSPME